MVVTVVTIAANVAAAALDLVEARFVVANATEVGLPRWSVRPLGAVKVVGIAGLVLGLLGAPLVGEAAAAGLVLFYVGAVAAHVRVRVLYNLYFAGSFLALAVASLVLALMV
ncbi:DoxX family protein [Nocardiopsis sp. CNR-923]|uniref:DoxX family protein n=1 Tax=Nocardiopsis sp. CNR-923 TaxID=1904965 RepID=UPI0021CCAFFF|nr:DoxX family protein [Nocardiopsis sp. CNR-923]